MDNARTQDQVSTHSEDCYRWHYVCAITRLETLAQDFARVRRECDLRAKALDEVEQIAGRALGYTRYCDDQLNFPDSTDADGVCIGEHVAETIVQELADAYRTLKERT